MKNHSLASSFRHAFDGILAALKSERNMKIHIVCASAVIILGSILKLQIWEWLVCLAWIALVIGGELFNTAIEATVDLAMPKLHPLAKKAKDASAGAVMVFAIGAAVSGAVIFLPKVLALFR